MLITKWCGPCIHTSMINSSLKVETLFIQDVWRNFGLYVVNLQWTNHISWRSHCTLDVVKSMLRRYWLKIHLAIQLEMSQLTATSDGFILLITSVFTYSLQKVKVLPLLLLKENLKQLLLVHLQQLVFLLNCLSDSILTYKIFFEVNRKQPISNLPLRYSFCFKLP